MQGMCYISPSMTKHPICNTALPPMSLSCFMIGQLCKEFACIIPCISMRCEALQTYLWLAG